MSTTPPLALRGPALECADDLRQPLAARGQRVLDARRPRVHDAPLEHARLLELDEPLRQGPWRDADEHLLELVEPHGTGLRRREDDPERPAAPEEVRRAGDLLGQRPAATTPHYAASCCACTGSSARSSTSPSVITGW